MSSLSHYRVGSTILICPMGELTPVIEVEIIGKAQGRGKHKTSVKVHADRALDIFGDKHKAMSDGRAVNIIVASDTAWLSPDGWEVIGKINKAAKHVA